MASTIYDEVLYGDEPFASTHPETLSSIGRLFGLDPAPPEKCRFLEIGSARGNNLIGMAFAAPNSDFVGIELSGRQVQIGNELISELGLSNINLIEKDILNVSDDLGKFDFIVAHGVLSWVSSKVRDKIFSICSSHLTENGICYLSYNTYPGWKARDIFRDVMLFESNGEISHENQVASSRRGLDLINQIVSDGEGSFASRLREELPAFLQRPDWYYLHDFIAEHNQPYYVHEIFKWSNKVGLKYFADTELSSCTLQGISSNAANVIKSLRHDPVRFEQYSDIARGRSFRRSLLCKIEKHTSQTISANSIKSLFVALEVEIENDQGQSQFKHPNGGIIKTLPGPLSTALSLISSRWPQALAVKDIVDLLERQNFSNSEIDGVLLGILSGIFANIIDLRTSEGVCTNQISVRPRASNLARAQAKRGGQVTSLLHKIIDLNDFERQLLCLLDGNLNQEDILRILFQDCIPGPIDLQKFSSAMEKLLRSALILKN